MENFQNDNTSPETSSFYVVSPKSDHGPGRALHGNGRPLLLTQLLVSMPIKIRAGGAWSEGDDAVAASADPAENAERFVSDAFYRGSS